MAAIDASTSNGSAHYERTDTVASLSFEISAPPIVVSTGKHSLAEATEIACTAEIEHVRRAVRELVAEMLASLPPTKETLEFSLGKHVWNEVRDWKRLGRWLLIRPAGLSSETCAPVTGDIPDAAVIAALSRNAIENRREAARAVYGQVLVDVSARPVSKDESPTSADGSADELNSGIPGDDCYDRAGE
jgi:hypothetical protein